MAGSPAATCRVASPVFPACTGVPGLSYARLANGNAEVGVQCLVQSQGTVRRQSAPHGYSTGCPRRLSRLVGTLRLVALGRRARGPQDDGGWLDGGAVRVRRGT